MPENTKSTIGRIFLILAIVALYFLSFISFLFGIYQHNFGDFDRALLLYATGSISGLLGTFVKNRYNDSKNIKGYWEKDIKLGEYF